MPGRGQSGAMPWPPSDAAGQPAPSPGPGLPSAAAAPPRWRGASGRFRILIVEDDPDLRASLTEALARRFDADIVGVGDAAAAQRLLAASRCDVVLLDHQLPDREGSQLLAWMGQRRLRARAIVITGLSEERLASSPLLLGGAHAVLRKPFEFGQLAGLIRDAAGEEGSTRGRTI